MLYIQSYLYLCLDCKLLEAKTTPIPGAHTAEQCHTPQIINNEQ